MVDIIRKTLRNRDRDAGGGGQGDSPGVEPGSQASLPEIGSVASSSKDGGKCKTNKVPDCGGNRKKPRASGSGHDQGGWGNWQKIPEDGQRNSWKSSTR